MQRAWKSQHPALPQTFPRHHTDPGQSGGLPGEKGSLPALRAGGGAPGLLHRGAADRAESGPGGTGSHPLDDQPTIVNNPTGSPVRAVITPIFGHHPNEKSDLKHHVHADNPK